MLANRSRIVLFALEKNVIFALRTDASTSCANPKMEGLIIVIDRLGRTIAQLEEDNIGLRAQLESLGRQIAEQATVDDDGSR